MTDCAPSKSSQICRSVAIGIVALFETTSLPGCAERGSYTPPPMPIRSPHYEAGKPVQIERQGALWRSWEVPGSKVTVIHMRNHHLAGFASPEAPAAAPFWAAQSEMFALMKECHSQSPIAALYGDGATDKYIDWYNQELAAQSARLNTARGKDLKRLLAGSCDALKAQGAIAGFAILYGMKLNYGESFELHQRARAARLAKSLDADDLVMRQREDFLLSRIYADFPQGAVTVMTTFGADHLLWDNIQRWNQAHPDYTFSLLEVSAHKVRELGAEL